MKSEAIITLYAELILTVPSGVTPPTAPPEKVMLLVPAVRTRSKPPSSGPKKLMPAPTGVPPELVVSTAAFPIRLTGPSKVTTPPAVVTSAPS